MLPGKTVECEASGAFREHCHIYGNVTLQDQGICLLLSVGRLSEVECSCRVGRSIDVLTTRVAEVDGCRVDDCTCFLLG